MKIVLSASRRTDIPAFYMDWFMAREREGSFPVENPYSGRINSVPATPDQIHTIVFWSKNFGPFLKGRFGETLQQTGYHLFFHFTLNSKDRFLEPEVPPLQERIRQLEALSALVPPAAVTWRFDPLCFYRLKTGAVKNNLGDFKEIARAAGACGIRRCVTSFIHPYAKVNRRARARGDCEFVEIHPDQRIDILLRMEEVLSDEGVDLHLCCQKDLLEALPAGSGIRAGACISHEQIRSVYGGDLSGKKDRGQRGKQGCRCDESKDIGSYRLHPCFHNCLFCYANPKTQQD
jgi:hypothetical protein